MNESQAMDGQKDIDVVLIAQEYCYVVYAEQSNAITRGNYRRLLKSIEPMRLFALFPLVFITGGIA